MKILIYILRNLKCLRFTFSFLKNLFMCLLLLFYTLNFFYSFNKTPLGETGCLSNLYHLLSAQASGFLIHSFSQIESVGTPLVPYHSLCSASVTYGMPRHDIGYQVHPTHLLPREAEDFPTDCKYLKDVSLLTFLAYLQPVESIILYLYLCMSKSWMFLLVAKRLVN